MKKKSKKNINLTFAMPSIFKQIEKLWKIVEKKHRKKIKIVSVYLPITQIKHKINTALMLVSEYCLSLRDIRPFLYRNGSCNLVVTTRYKYNNTLNS